MSDSEPLPTPSFLLDSRRSFWGAVGFGLIPTVGALDYLTGYELAFSLFYLLPVSTVAWFVVRGLGLLAALLSAGMWALADAAAGQVYSHSLIYFWNGLIRFSFFMVVAVLLKTMRTMIEHERDLARLDFLTGAVNSRSFAEMLTAEIDRLDRYQHPFTIAYIDLDNFKPVNDQYGHSEGDRALRVVVDCAKRHLRRTDTVARLGGDEFALLMPETDGTKAKAAVEKLHRVLLAAMDEHHWPITYSIGVLTCTATPKGPDEVIRRVDDLMYQAKRDGKNRARYQVYGGENA